MPETKHYETSREVSVQLSEAWELLAKARRELNDAMKVCLPFQEAANRAEMLVSNLETRLAVAKQKEASSRAVSNG